MGKKFEHGELNPFVYPRTGMTLDPDRFSAFHLQSSLIEKLLKPPLPLDQVDRFKGIVLDLEPDLMTPDGGLPRVRVRIPELHPFPEPEIYGPEGPRGIISLYPIFVAENTDIPKPEVGEEVYVDFGDRINMEDPKYYGSVYKKALNGGVNVIKDKVDDVLDKFKSAANNLKDYLNPPNTTNNSPLPTVKTNNTPNINTGDIDCSRYQAMLSKCYRFDVPGPGTYQVTLGGKPAGSVKLVQWISNNGQKTLVRAEHFDILTKMSQDILKGLNLHLIIRAGFRTYETQKCMYETYIHCLEQWKKNGEKGSKPTIAGNPNKSGENSHLNGMAFDFGAEANKDDAKIHKWLRDNGQKYGFYPNVPSEPWHFAFSETLAIQGGLYKK